MRSVPGGRSPRGIRGRGGDDILAHEANRSGMLADVGTCFADLPLGTVRRHEPWRRTTAGSRLARHAVGHNVAWLFSDRRCAGEPAFPDLARAGMIEAETERGGKPERERRFDLASAKLDPAAVARAVRGHGKIENRLPWVLGVVFRDDLARLRTGHAPENMTVVRRLAMNLLRQAQPVTCRKNRRQLAGWNLDGLDRLIRGLA